MDTTARIKLYVEGLYEASKLSLNTAQTIELKLAHDVVIPSTKLVEARTGIGVDVDIYSFNVKIKPVVVPSLDIREHEVAVALWDTYESGGEIIFGLTTLKKDCIIKLSEGIVIGYLHLLPILISGHYEIPSGAVH